jgi:hypothetical protein
MLLPSFGHSVCNGKFGEIEFVDELLHQVNGNCRPRRYPCAAWSMNV